MKLLSSGPETKQSASLRSPDDAMADALERMKRVKYMRVRLPRLERLCRPQSESFWVLGGRPGSFKTGLAWNMALNAAEEGQRVLFVSLEMTPAEIALLGLARFSGLDRRRIERHFMTRDQVLFRSEEQLVWDRAILRLQALELQLRVHGAEDHGRGINDVLHSACRNRFDAVFVDHAGMIGRDSGRELDVLSNVIDRLRGLSRGEVVKGYRPWVLVTTQLSRGIDKGEDRIPMLADFRGSARFEHDADVAIGLQVRKRAADSENPVSQLDGFVLKNRFGPPSTVLLFEANGATGLVSERHPNTEPEQEEIR